MSILIFYVWVVSSAIFFKYFYSFILLGVITSFSLNGKLFFVYFTERLIHTAFPINFDILKLLITSYSWTIFSIQDFNFNSSFYTRSLQFLSQVSIDKFSLTIAGQHCICMCLLFRMDLSDFSRCNPFWFLHKSWNSHWSCYCHLPICFLLGCCIHEYL